MADNTSALTKYDFVPEFNFWVRNVLTGSPVNTDHILHKPLQLDEDTWRSDGSLLDLLFNYTFDSPNMSIFFRKVARGKILDPALKTRIFIYASQLSVYASDPSYTIYDDPTIDAEYGMSTEVIPDGETEIDITTPELYDASDVTEYNIYQITYGEFDMLTLLFAHKSGIPVLLDDIDYNSLPSALSKLIYSYLKVEVDEDYTYYSGTTPIGNSDDRLLVRAYDKYVGDHYYNRIKVRPSFVKNEFEPELLNTDSTSEIRILTTQEVSNKEITFDIPVIPYGAEAFVIYYDGKLQKPETDYDYELHAIDSTSIRSALIWNGLGLESKVQADSIMYLLWGYVLDEEDLLS